MVVVIPTYQFRENPKFPLFGAEVGFTFLRFLLISASEVFPVVANPFDVVTPVCYGAFCMEVILCR